MKVGAMNNPRKDIYEEINRISDQRFDFIDLTYEWPSNQKADSKRVKALTDQKKLGIIGHSSPSLPVIYPIPTIHDPAFLELKKTLNFFSKLGIDRLNIHPFYYTVHSDARHIVDKNLLILIKFAALCQQQHIKLMFENFIYPFDDIDTVKLLLDSVPELYLHIDVGHFNFQPGMIKKLAKFIEKFHKKIIHYHIHDNNGLKDDHLPLGCGNINWFEVTKLIKNSGYDDTFTLEVFSEDYHYLMYSREKWIELWESA